MLWAFTLGDVGNCDKHLVLIIFSLINNYHPTMNKITHHESYIVKHVGPNHVGCKLEMKFLPKRAHKTIEKCTNDSRTDFGGSRSTKE